LAWLTKYAVLPNTWNVEFARNLRQVFNLALRGELWPPRVKLAPRGLLWPLGVKFAPRGDDSLFAPPFF
jgi:hypothetical protein